MSYICIFTYTHLLFWSALDRFFPGVGYSAPYIQSGKSGNKIAFVSLGPYAPAEYSKHTVADQTSSQLLVFIQPNCEIRCRFLGEKNKSSSILGMRSQISVILLTLYVVCPQQNPWQPVHHLSKKLQYDTKRFFDQNTSKSPNK